MSPLREKIAELRSLDRELDVFGARTHRYEGQVVTRGELSGFEAWCGRELPEDYRSYALEVGLGVGPYHGLLPFSRIRWELEAIYDSFDEVHGVSVLPSRPLDIEPRLLAARDAGDAYDPAEAELLEGPGSGAGYLPICEQGCEFLAALVIVGELRGRVFDTTGMAGCRAKWRPARPAPGLLQAGLSEELARAYPRFPTFEEWVEAWVDRALGDLRG